MPPSLTGALVKTARCGTGFFPVRASRLPAHQADLLPEAVIRQRIRCKRLAGALSPSCFLRLQRPPVEKCAERQRTVFCRRLRHAPERFVRYLAAALQYFLQIDAGKSRQMRLPVKQLPQRRTLLPLRYPRVQPIPNSHYQSFSCAMQ